MPTIHPAIRPSVHPSIHPSFLANPGLGKVFQVPTRTWTCLEDYKEQAPDQLDLQ